MIVRPSVFYMVLGSFAFLASTALLVLGLSQTNREVTVASPIFSAGSVRQNSKVEGVFRITNNLDVAIRIKDVLRDCDCTEARFSQADLNPGGTSEIVVVWDTGRRKGKSVANLAVAYYELTEARSEDLIRLKVVADIVPDYVCDPERLELVRGVPRVANIRFVPVGNTGFKLLKVTSNHPDLLIHRQSDLSIDVEYRPKQGVPASSLEGSRLSLFTVNEMEPDGIYEISVE